MKSLAAALVLCACGGRVVDEGVAVDASVHDAKPDVVDASTFDTFAKPDVVAPQATTCADVLANGNTTSGDYEVVQNGKTLTVYCDMTIAGGGFTAFFSGVIGSAPLHFEDKNDNCPAPSADCLRHVPGWLPNTTIFAASCGDDAVVFEASLPTIAYFGAGLQKRWQPLANVTAGKGNPNLAYATQIWTGDTSNRGWIISNDDNEPSFTPHTFASAYDWNQTWNFCNGTPSTTAIVRLLYR